MGGQVSGVGPAAREGGCCPSGPAPCPRWRAALKEHQLVNFEKTCLHFTHGQARTHKSMSKQSDVQ